ncbi:MAG: hypothetical protein PHX87_03995 [Candidatus Peribacteraceae bacterium]|nr:hypothetical protein [Candidatus Peribacteraceae bacterium]MDD5742565.1 hypothetical protein [Candidatus Peribacteraceae bacterium]
MKTKTNRESSSSSKPLRPNEEQVQAKISAKLLEARIPGREYWEESLLSLWQDAIDMDCGQELAREKMEEALRGVISSHHLQLGAVELRKRMNALFSQLSMEINTHAQNIQGEPQLPLTQEEQREAERQRRRDDDPKIQWRQTSAQGGKDRRMRQHRVNSAGHTSPGVQQTF